uniref:Uncharacterized protein n=1 Tax=Ditylenchus dipsaci TaxID=166011 RepID=A0A915DJ76_9BILA
MKNSAGSLQTSSKCHKLHLAQDHSFTPNFVRRRRYGQAVAPVEDYQQDSFAAYRQLAEVRMRRLERYKKAKSLCSLNNNPHCSAIGSNLLASQRTSSTGHLGGEWHNGQAKPLRYSPPPPQFSASHSNLLLYSNLPSNSNMDDSICVDSESPGYCGPKLKTNYYNDYDQVPSSSGSSQYSGCERENTVASPKATPVPAASLQFEVLREKNGKLLIVKTKFGPTAEDKISLMENDVQLLQKLLTLGETIQELRRDTKHPIVAQPSLAAATAKRVQKGSSSNNSSLSSSPSIELDDQHHNNHYADNDNDEDSVDLESELQDKWRPLGSSGLSLANAITHLYVEGSEEDRKSEEQDQLCPKVQYFSRKNSVLRIPIPPRASNRFNAGKRVMARGPAELARCGRLVSAQQPVANDQEDSGHSSTSNSPSAQCSPTTAVSSGQDSGHGNSSTDGGSSRFSTFSSISSASITTSACPPHNNLIASHAEGEKSCHILEHTQKYIDATACATKCCKSAITEPFKTKQENKLELK